jgi:acyl-CoA synthetase (AMP-forming)/AMP-acid ligase II/outer membrane protein assembly factor BamB/acyl carrier protein
MCDAGLLREYGIVNAFDTVANMCGEKVALIASFQQESKQVIDEIDLPNDEIDTSGDIEPSEEENGLDIDGATYFEIQQNSILLSNQLRMRFGVMKGDPVLIIGYGNTGAELTSMLACMRIGALFVPAPFRKQQLYHSKSEDVKFKDIIDNCHADIAILVGKNDEDPMVQFLADFRIHKYTLLDELGNLTDSDPSTQFTSQYTQEEAIFQNDNNDNDLYSEDNVEAQKEDDKINSKKFNEPIYLLYTSGSTGRSKGVFGTQQGLINRIAWQYNTFPYEFHEVMVRRTPLSFVDSLVEIFAPLIAGISICTCLIQSINEEGVLSAIEIMDSLNITRLTLIPSQLMQFCTLLSSSTELKANNLTQQKVISPHDNGALEDIRREKWSCLKYITVSGEECTNTLVEYFRKYFIPQISSQCILINLYGSTELAGDISYCIVYDPHREIKQNSVENSLVPIGQVINGNYMFIVSREEHGIDTNDNSETEHVTTTTTMTLLPLERQGELLVIGEHVSHGYYDGISHSKNSFVPNPFLNPHFLQKNNDLIWSIYYSHYCISLSHEEHLINSEEESLRRQQFLKRLQSFPIAFCTGDLASVTVSHDSNKYNDQSSSPSIFYWHGRMDSVIKYHGEKISLQEIESSIQLVLKVQNQNRDVSLIVLPIIPTANQQTSDAQLQHQQQQQLLALIIEKKSILQSLAEDENENMNRWTSWKVREYLHHIGPINIIPQIILLIDEFPRNTSYKIDRLQLQQELSKLLQTEQVTEYANLPNPNVAMSFAPQETEILQQVISVCSKLLPFIHSQSSSVTNWIDKSFYDLGGDSMTAIEFLWQLKSLFSVVILTLEHTQLSLLSLSHYIISSMNQQPALEILKSHLKSNEVISIRTSILDTEDEDGHITKRAKIMNSSAPLPSINPLFSEFFTNNIHWYQCIQRGNESSSIDIASSTQDETATASGTRKNIATDLYQTSLTMNFDTECLSLEIDHHYILSKCVDASPTIVLGRNQTNTFSNQHHALSIIGCHGGDIIAFLIHNKHENEDQQRQSSSSVSNNHSKWLWKLSLKEHIESAVAISLQSQLVVVSSYLGKDVDGFDTDQYLASSESKSFRGRIRALDLNTGSIQWTIYLIRECKQTGTIIQFPSKPLYDYMLIGDYEGNLYLIDIVNGCIVQRFDGLNGPIYVSPHVLRMNSSNRVEVLVCTVRGTIYLFSISMNMNQEEESEFGIDLVTSYDLSEETNIFAKPGIVQSSIGEYFIVIAGTDGIVRKLKYQVMSENKEDKTSQTSSTLHMIWEQTLSTAAFFSPCVVQYPLLDQEEQQEEICVLLGSHDGIVRQIGIESEQLLSLIPLHTVVFSTVFPFTIFDSMTNRYHLLLVVTTTAGYVYILNINTEEILTTIKLPAEIFSSPVIYLRSSVNSLPLVESLNVILGQIIIGCRDDHVYCINIRKNDKKN